MRAYLATIRLHSRASAGYSRLASSSKDIDSGDGLFTSITHLRRSTSCEPKASAGYQHLADNWQQIHLHHTIVTASTLPNAIEGWLRANMLREAKAGPAALHRGMLVRGHKRHSPHEGVAQSHVFHMAWRLGQHADASGVYYCTSS